MYISLIVGMINIILDFCLVLGIESYIPPMGVSGAAWASVIAQIVMLLCSIFCIYKYTPFNLKISSKINLFFKEMLLIFFNMFIRTMVLNIVFIVSNRFANSYGNSSLAAYTIGYNIWIITSFFIDGYSNAGNALAGKFLGEKNNTKLKMLGNILLKTNIKISLILVALYSISYPFIADLFNQDIEVKNIFLGTFWIVIIAQPFNAIAFTFDGIFKGLGRAIELRNTLTVATFIVFLPSIYLLNYFESGIYCIWISISLWMIYRGGSLYYLFKRTVNK